MENAMLHEIRDALNQELVLGHDDFKEKIEQMTKRQTRAITRIREQYSLILETIVF